MHIVHTMYEHIMHNINNIIMYFCFPAYTVQATRTTLHIKEFPALIYALS